MSSIGGILSTAARALVTHQKAMAVTSHNISNAQTPGYSRQRAVLQASPPLITPDGMIGTGVELAEVDRIRDPLLDDVYRRETATTSFHSERADQLGGIEETFGEPSDTGLLATLDQFWNAWSDLAVDPLSDAARSVVRERAVQVGDRFHQLVSGIDEQRVAGEQRLEQLIGRTNELADHIADLNGRIVAAEAGGAEAGDLRDARDIALDELSTLVGVQVVNRDNGAVGVYVEGQALVDGSTSRQLQGVEAGTGITGIEFENGRAPIREPGGRIGGLMGVLQGELSETRADLLEFAEAFADTVNGIHRRGTSPDGDFDQPFFQTHPDGSPVLEGGRPMLDPAIEDRLTAIAAGVGDPDGTWQSGATDVAREIERLREQGIAALGTGAAPAPSFAERYSTMVTGIGSKVAGAESSAKVHETLSQRADIRRDEVAGVSIDEELTAMIQQQAAYGAAAKVVTRVDEMLQTLLGIV